MRRAGAAGRLSWHDLRAVRGLIAYFRENPQVFVLLVVCVVLGLGTFIAVIISLIASGNTQTTGEPSGVISFLLTPVSWALARGPPARSGGATSWAVAAGARDDSLPNGRVAARAAAARPARARCSGRDGRRRCPGGGRAPSAAGAGAGAR